MTQLQKRSVGQLIYFQKVQCSLSEKLLHNYVEWTANKRMKAIGLKPKYDQGKSNPLP